MTQHPDTQATAPGRQTFVFLAAVTFDSCLSGRTRRLTEALADDGHRVVFVEMPSVRQALQPARLLQRSFVSAEGVQVLRLPPVPWRIRSNSPRLTQIWTRHAVSVLQRAVPDIHLAALITSTPWWLPLMQALPAAVRCYDYLDHIDVQAGPGRIELFRAWDRDLLDLCNVLTTVSEPLRRHLAATLPHHQPHLVPNGVCGDWIESPVRAVPRQSLTPRPDAPIAGFLGALFEWVDLDLLAEAAARLDTVEFAIVGPTRRGVNIDRLHRVPNIRCHGAVPFEQVPATLAAFDVCLIPFKQDLISEFADPLKVYEYCALGKPVVSTVLFNAGGPEPPIAVATNADAFAAAIRSALDETPADRERRIAFARQHTWEARARHFAEITAAQLNAE